MGPVPASREDDPRTVVTPFNHLEVEALLHKYGIYHDWSHIVNGLRDGFDVGIPIPPSATQTF